MNYISLLGQYFGQPVINTWLTQIEISATPRLKRGDDTAYLSNNSLGIELTFVDSESLTQRQWDYPDGALVLLNIRFYGLNTDDFSVYQGELPFGISFKDKKSDLVAKFGEPNWVNSPGTKLRWDISGCWLLASLNDSDEVEIVSLQLPK